MRSIGVWVLLALATGCQPHQGAKPTVAAPADQLEKTSENDPDNMAGNVPDNSPTDAPSGQQAPPRPSWPHWLGPERDGISRETGWSCTWPPSGLPVRWTREIGIGFSSITCFEGYLYTMGYHQGEEVVHCLRADTGETVWSHHYRGELLDNLHDGGPGSTPAIDGDHVYTLGKSGQLYCLDRRTGEVQWHQEIQATLDVELPEWGFASSPVIRDDRLYLEVGRVVALQKQTGDTLWQSDKHTAGYGSAAILMWQGEPHLATLDCDGLRVLAADDGQPLAFVPWESRFDTNATTPIVRDDRIFISTAYDVGCGLFRMTPQGLELIYKNREMRNHFNNSILWNGLLFGFDGNSNLGRVVQLTCMDWQTGDVLWQQRGLGCGSLVIADGKLLILSEDGTLVVAEATREGYRELARSPFLEGRCWTVPTLVDGRIYGRNAVGKLVCVDLP